MRPDVEQYLREQGWVFAGVSQPDHKRQWAKMNGDKVERVALEEDLEDLALELVGETNPKDCTTCRYGYKDERLDIPLCHHPLRFAKDCVNFNMHEPYEESEKLTTNKIINLKV